MQESIKKMQEGKITWAEFKQLMENAGVNDNDEIDRIDVAWGTVDMVSIKKDEIYGWQIVL